MKKSIVLLIFPLFYLLSCNRDNSLLTPGFTAEYFPLQVGNTWTYESSLDSSLSVYEITGTKVFNGRDYFELKVTFEDSTDFIRYFRIAEDNVVLIFYENQEHIYIDFEKPIGEEWESYGNFYGYIRQQNISTVVEAGNFNNLTEVFMDNRTLSDLFEYNRYAANVGLVESIKFRFSLTLKSAKVNGITYPQ